jgi:crotonobetainyl-CoA:carnitine CoA-transferase CaiB-like acyl-CoA transferase
MRLGPEQASEMGGLALALGALIALYGARADDVGEVVDIALERVCALVTLQMSNASLYHQFGFVRERKARGTGGERLFRASDGFVSFGLGRDPRGAVGALARLGVGDELQRLLDKHGHEQLAALGEAEQAVARALARVTRASLVEAAQAVGVMAMAVQDAADIAADPFLRERAFFVEVEHPGLGVRLTDAALPFLVEGRRVALARRPPLLSEHTDEVLGWAGLNVAEVANLRQAGVC